MSTPGQLPLPIDPDFVEGLALLPNLAFTAQSLPTMRELMAGMQATLPTDAVTIEEATIDERVIVRILRPAGGSTEGRPAILWIHGGGYMTGTRAIDDGRLGGWIMALGCVAASVEYRLAPEHPYPAPLDDCSTALTWLRDHAEEMGIDRSRIGVAGASAGGGLAAALTLLTRHRGEPPVAFQLLDSPMIDDRQITTSSNYDGLPLWNRESNEFGWRSYLGDLYGADDIPDTAAAARADDLSGLPPALIVVGGADGFRDENIEYATRLQHAGVPVELHVYPGAPHGFSLFAEAAVTRQAEQDQRRWLTRRFADRP